LRVVLDTNVFVSGLISPAGPPGEVLRLLEAAPIVPCFSEGILREYQDVLTRPKFGFPAATVAALLRLLTAVGERITEDRSPSALPDPADEIFLAVALSAHADFLVTGNLRDFPERLRQEISVVSPREFLDAFHRR
jgi:putative PIN family toxin of toxin-antitoxin system